jgi:hypothetical protein
MLDLAWLQGDIAVRQRDGPSAAVQQTWIDAMANIARSERLSRGCSQSPVTCRALRFTEEGDDWVVTAAPVSIR